MSCRGKNIHYAKLKLELHEVGTAALILDSSLNTEQATEQVQAVNCSFTVEGQPDAVAVLVQHKVEEKQQDLAGGAESATE